MNRVIIALGSNLGDRTQNLKHALTHLPFIDKLSDAIETEALLLPDSPDSWNIPYLNQVASGNYHDSPQELLILLKSIEAKMGRPSRYPRFSPRIIDLDILIFGKLNITTDQLTIPHPELFNRNFAENLARQIEPELIEFASMNTTHH